MSKLPLDFGIFWKTLLVIAVLVVVGWWAVIKFGFYDAMTPADYVGTTISTILLSYLVHLWILPADVLRGDQPESDDEAGR
jgi:hypothetical protein